MRIALLSADWRLSGGVATYVRMAASALAAAGHDVLVVHADMLAPEASPAGVTIVCVPGALRAAASTDAAAIREVLEAVEQFAPDVVHFHSSNNFPLEDALRRRLPVVKTLHVHEYCPAGTKYHFASERPCVHPTGWMCVPRMGYLRCTLSRRPNVIWSLYQQTTKANQHHRAFGDLIACSDYVKRQAVQTGFDADRLTVVPYFTEMPAHPMNPASAEAPTSRDILFVGRLVHHKGVDLLLEALGHVRGVWRAVIAGEGPEAAALERRAAELGIGDRVTFPGWLTGELLSAAYRDAAVVVIPSRWPEPFGIVGLEALAQARPVVAFAVGGIPEWLCEGIGGFPVAPLDVRALAERIEWLLNHPDDARRIADLGRARVLQDFTAASHLSRLLPVYERLRAQR